MPKATLKYELPDDKFEFHLAVKSWDFWSKLTDLDNLLRSWIKHDSCPFDSKIDAFEYLRDRIAEVDLNENL